MAFVFVAEVAFIPFTADGIVLGLPLSRVLVAVVICLENVRDGGERVPDVDVGD